MKLIYVSQTLAPILPRTLNLFSRVLNTFKNQLLQNFYVFLHFRKRLIFFVSEMSDIYSQKRKNDLMNKEYFWIYEIEKT